jgi:hypothetical protein
MQESREHAALKMEYREMESGSKPALFPGMLTNHPKLLCFDALQL